MVQATASVRWSALSLTLASLLTAGFTEGAATEPAEGTRRMVERLARLREEANPQNNMFLNAPRAEYIARLIENSRGGLPPLPPTPAREFLNAGRTEEAIKLLERFEAEMRARKAPTDSPAWVSLRLQQGLAYIRRGEEANCFEHHGARSCIFPISGSGVHKVQGGSRAAVAILSELLTQNPGELSARWLLNIAHMTLGEYPDAVPTQWLLPPELFESEYDIKPFPDIAHALGLDVKDMAGGSIVDDLDGDGYMDIMASGWGLQSQIRFFHNNVDGTFTERTTETGLTGITGGLQIMPTDYDNDGRIDVLIMRGAWLGEEGRHPNSLLHNDGGGAFSDVTEDAGMLSFHPGQAAVWFDFNADGWLDVFIGNETRGDAPHPCELYRNNGNGTFTNCAREAGVDRTGFVKGVASGDFNNDGRRDLYLSLLGAPNRLYRNDGPAAGSTGNEGASACAWKFTEIGASAGVTEPMHSFPTWFWDYDNDGWEDIFASGYRLDNIGEQAADYLGLEHHGELPRLYRNNGDETFTDVTIPAHLNRLLVTMGSDYGDLDNDGWLDFYATTGAPDLSMLMPNRMFRNAEGRFFQDVTTSGGFGHLQKGHGVSFADLDNDGDQDIYHVVGGAFEADAFYNALFENPGHGNHWTSLNLVGVRSNRAGIGARIKVVVQSPSGPRTIYRTAGSRSSFGGAPLRMEIGLGSAKRIDRVEILWPSGGPVQVIDGLAVDRRYLIREGAARAEPITLKELRLGGK